MKAKVVFWIYYGPQKLSKNHRLHFVRTITIRDPRSEFCHLRRKSALIFSKWLFFQNSEPLKRGQKMKIKLNVSPLTIVNILF